MDQDCFRSNACFVGSLCCKLKWSNNLIFFYLAIQDIQHLPWESIPMLFDQPVTRVPSLQFLLSKVHSHVIDLLRSLLAQLVSLLNDFYSVLFTRDTRLTN